VVKMTRAFLVLHSVPDTAAMPGIKVTVIMNNE